MSSVTKTPAAGGGSGRSARADRPVRFEDPERNAAYWRRIDGIVAAAPPLSDEQRAIIRTAFTQPEARRAA